MGKVKTWFLGIFKAISQIFEPIVPVIATIGVIKGLLDVYTLLNPVYYQFKAFTLLYLIINTAITYLPVLVAISTANVFGGNKFASAIVGLILLNPGLTSVMDIASGADTNTLWIWYGLWSIPDNSYHGFIIPVILIVWLMCRLEKWLSKVTYKSLQPSLVPLLSIFITSFLALTIIGPLFSLLANPFYELIKLSLTLPYHLGSVVTGILFFPAQILGIDYMLPSIAASLIEENGMNTLMPIISCCAMAQGGATLAVCFKAKDKGEHKSVLVPAALSAFFGVTESSVFGVNLKYGMPFVAGIIGGAIGAFVASYLGVYSTTNGVLGLSGCIFTIQTELYYIISILLSAAIAFAITLFWLKRSGK